VFVIPQLLKQEISFAVKNLSTRNIVNNLIANKKPNSDILLLLELRSV